MGFVNGQLSIPGEAIADPRAQEMLRVWVANQGLHISLRIGVWSDNPDVDERKAWGIVLADAVKHIADALETAGHDKGDTVARIRGSFLAELDEPTSPATGDFSDGLSHN